MKKQKIITTIMLLGIGAAVLANEVLQSTKLNDGTYIRMCRFNNGRIDYCTVEDAKNAIRMVNNPNLLLSKAELANKKAMQAKIANDFPIVNIIPDTLNGYKKELNQLQDKMRLDISVDSAKISLLRYKISILDEMAGDFMTYYNGEDNKTMSGAFGLSSKYESLINALNSKDITQGEYTEAKLKLIKTSEDLTYLHSKLLALNVTPEDNNSCWIGHNLPNANQDDILNNNSDLMPGQHTVSQNAQYSQPTQYNTVQPKSTLFQVKNKIDEANNVTNSVVNGLYLLKGLTRY
ncbi:MAG: hypothetical protein WCG95_09075 [bacterium]